VVQLPCGYAPTMFGGASSFNFIDNLVPVAERTLDWAFIGSMKSDRHEMCTMFDRYFKNGHCTVGNNSWDATNQIIKPCDMAAIYRKTIFVPIGRGFVTLDCFRCYEALLCGAIPIIVGPEDEINKLIGLMGAGPRLLVRRRGPMLRRNVGRCEIVLWGFLSYKICKRRTWLGGKG